MTSRLSALISSRTRAFATGLLCLLALAFAPVGLRAQPGTGSIAGAVSNQSTRLFLDRAEIKIDGTNRTVLTDRDGTYALTGLAAGTYDLVVSYTGLDTERRRVTVSAGAKAAQDFTLTSGIYKLGAFTVAAEAEGNAAAVAEMDAQIGESQAHAAQFRSTLDKAQKRFAALAKVEERHARHYQAQLDKISA